MIDRVSGAYGRLLAGLALVGCAILMAMTLIIVADVALRNMAMPGLPQGHVVGAVELVGVLVGLGLTATTRTPCSPKTPGRGQLAQTGSAKAPAIGHRHLSSCAGARPSEQAR